MSNFAKLGLILFAILMLIAVNLYRYDQPIEVTPIVINAKKTDQTLLTQETNTVQTVGQLAELKFIQTYSRPLFSENRRKYIKPPPPKKKPAPVKKVAKKPAPVLPPPNLQILGISQSNGTMKTLVKLDTSPDSEWISKGETISGWEVQEITNDSVTIVNADREISIGLYTEN